MLSSHHVSPDLIRDMFSKAMSEMYQKEVPLYANLLNLVAQVNHAELEDDEQLRSRMEKSGELNRLRVERHGAIRVGTAEELSLLRRLFAVMGMYPVGYYDLTEAGVPVHATAFRPITEESLQKNPFRVFTSLLRLDLIEDKKLRKIASEILSSRNIFTKRALELIETCERHKGLRLEQTEEFVAEALETFRWHSDSTVDKDTYEALHAEHRLIADVVCFRGPHINHLTPRTLNIDEVQRLMPLHGISPKAIIEGPPRRNCPVLLRQTSFKALDEPVNFSGDQQGSHTARFGEIEQRGAALTQKGRELYDHLLRKSQAQGRKMDNSEHQKNLRDAFSEFPDDEESLRKKGLVFFYYQPTFDVNEKTGKVENPDSLEDLVQTGTVSATPITYEDFLPVSAAGIFRSNLGEEANAMFEGNPNKAEFERHLGTSVNDEIEIYAEIERKSIADTLKQINQ
ncbi:2-oxoadipate dioxygenase/decarboxylase HglS [Litchfieldella rifensis]|uniref:2-oxoadipate dioxygenase/decarboxylase n=1 Tax=Litchfieldella rifensis TaxID=762643 RepID=A0ABV7LTB1_9GAMM